MKGSHYHDFSSLEREAGCPASHAEAQKEGTIPAGNEWMDRGSAIDRAYQLVLAEKPIDWSALATAYGVAEKADEIKAIVEAAPFPYEVRECQTEIEYDLGNEHGCVLRGHPDIIIDHGTYGEVWDVKALEDRSNAPDIGERFQIKGYSAVLAKQREWDRVRCGMFNPLSAESKRCSFVDLDHAGIEAISTSIMDLVDRCHGREDRISYRQGPWCQTCPAEPRCPYLQQSRTTMLALNGETMAAVPREKFPHLLSVARQIKRRAEEVESYVRDTVLVEGDIVGDDGLRAYKMSVHKRAAWTGKRILEWQGENGYLEAADAVEAEKQASPKMETFQVRVKKEKK